MVIRLILLLVGSQERKSLASPQQEASGGYQEAQGADIGAGIGAGAGNNARKSSRVRSLNGVIEVQLPSNYSADGA